MGDILSHYIGVFDADSLYGYRHIISLFSAFVFFWVLGLCYLIIKANPKGLEHRFMAMLLLCESTKVLFIAVDFLPSGSEFEALWNYIWFIKIELVFFGHITTFLMYLSFPFYYRIRALEFLYKEKYRRHAWYMAPCLGLLIWLFLRVQEGFMFENAAWIICDGSTTTPVLQSWWGIISPTMTDTAISVGSCSNTFNILIVDEPAGLWAIGIISSSSSIVALLFFRSAIKESLERGAEGTTTALTNRSLYLGFLGKVIGAVAFVVIFTIILPLLNGGEFVTFAQSIHFQFGENPSILDRTKLFLWISTQGIAALAIGFEALMFVHATLKDTVFGIDENLRKAFRATIFTGVSVVSFIVASEAMESMIGFGMAGGVFVGIGFFLARKPIMALIDGFSNQLISKEFTQEEQDYLESYALSMEDGNITTREKKLLNRLAESYKIDEQRRIMIESYHDSIQSEEE